MFVDPAALSEISEVEYDYSDLYDYQEEEQEAAKSRRDTKEAGIDTTTSTTTTSSVKSTSTKTTTSGPTINSYSSTTESIEQNQEMKVLEEKVQIQMKTNLIKQKYGKQEYLKSLNDNADEKATEEEKIHANMIRSAGDDVPSGSSTTSNEQTTFASEKMDEPSALEIEQIVENEEKENETITEEAKRQSSQTKEDRIKREISELQKLFEEKVDAARMEDFAHHPMVAKDPNMHKLAWRLKEHLRLKRSEMATEAMMTTEKPAPDPDACIVKNMTCVKFPSKKHCKGIALGRSVDIIPRPYFNVTTFRCGSRTDLLVGGAHLLTFALVASLSPAEFHLLRLLVLCLPLIAFSSVFGLVASIVVELFSIQPAFNIFS